MAIPAALARKSTLMHIYNKCALTHSVGANPVLTVEAVLAYHESITKFWSCGPQGQANVGSTRLDGKPCSLLYFQGLQQVSGLFEWLFDAVAAPVNMRAEGLDVPLLLAPVPFVGAAIKALQSQARFNATYSRLLRWCE